MVCSMRLVYGFSPCSQLPLLPCVSPVRPGHPAGNTSQFNLGFLVDSDPSPWDSALTSMGLERCNPCLRTHGHLGRPGKWVFCGFDRDRELSTRPYEHNT